MRNRKCLKSRAIHCIRKIVVIVCVSMVPSLQWETASAQTNGARQLSTPTVDFKIAKPFTRIWAVRELQNGDVLLCEKGEPGVFLYSATGKLIRQVSRDGDGPNEYRSPRTLTAVGQDSTLITGENGKPWALLHGTEFVKLPLRWAELSRTTNRDLPGVDHSGTILTVVGLQRGKNNRLIQQFPSMADTIIGLLLRTNGSTDTLRTLHAKSLGTRSVDLPNERMSMTFVLVNPFQSFDQGALFLDGTIAVAHYDPYGVDWMLNGELAKPKHYVIPTVARPVDTNAKLEAARRAYKSRDGSATFPPQMFPPWPKDIPPFVSNALVAGGDGRLYIRRTPVLESDSIAIDVVPRGMGRTETLLLPPRSRLIAVSVRGLYVAVLNEDDEEFLVRYKFAKGPAI